MLQIKSFQFVRFPSQSGSKCGYCFSLFFVLACGWFRVCTCTLLCVALAFSLNSGCVTFFLVQSGLYACPQLVFLLLVVHDMSSLHIGYICVFMYGNCLEYL